MTPQPIFIAATAKFTCYYCAQTPKVHGFFGCLTDKMPAATSSTLCNITQNFHFFVDKFDFGLIYFTCSTSEILCDVQYILGTGDIHITANMLYCVYL